MYSALHALHCRGGSCLAAWQGDRRMLETQMLLLQACPLFSALLEKALDLIRSCDCVVDSGCPGCIQHTGARSTMRCATGCATKSCSVT